MAARSPTSPHGRRLLRLSTVALFACSGCAMLGIEIPQSKAPEAEPIAMSPQDSAGETEMPFTMKILKEVNDGKELHVLGTIEARTTWDPANVLVRLTSLNAGEQVGVTYYSLAKLLEQSAPLEPGKGGTINADEEIRFSLAVSASGMTDYQLELLWGNEASRYIAEKRGSESLSLRVRSLEIETLRDGSQCTYEPCDIRFRLLGRLHNEGTGVIGRVVLGVGFVPVDSEDTVPLEEEQVEIPKLRLFAGDSRPFRLLLKKELSEDEANLLRPVLRVISFEGDEP